MGNCFQFLVLLHIPFSDYEFLAWEFIVVNWEKFSLSYSSLFAVKGKKSAPPILLLGVLYVNYDDHYKLKMNQLTIPQ